MPTSPCWSCGVQDLPGVITHIYPWSKSTSGSVERLLSLRPPVYAHENSIFLYSAYRRMEMSVMRQCFVFTAHVFHSCVKVAQNYCLCVNGCIVLANKTHKAKETTGVSMSFIRLVFLLQRRGLRFTGGYRQSARLHQGDKCDMAASWYLHWLQSGKEARCGWLQVDLLIPPAPSSVPHFSQSRFFSPRSEKVQPRPRESYLLSQWRLVEAGIKWWLQLKWNP